MNRALGVPSVEDAERFTDSRATADALRQQRHPLHRARRIAFA